MIIIIIVIHYYHHHYRSLNYCRPYLPRTTCRSLDKLFGEQKDGATSPTDAVSKDLGTCSLSSIILSFYLRQVRRSDRLNASSWTRVKETKALSNLQNDHYGFRAAFIEYASLLLLVSATYLLMYSGTSSTLFDPLGTGCPSVS